MFEKGKILHLNDQDLARLKDFILFGEKKFAFTALGKSMHPFFRSGDVIEITAANFKDLKIGDVILFHIKESNLAVHRVVNKILISNQLKLITKGDFASAIDGAIGEANFIGKAVAVKNSANWFIFKQLGLNKHWGPIIAKVSVLSGFLLSLLRRDKKSFYRNMLFYRVAKYTSSGIKQTKNE